MATITIDNFGGIAPRMHPTLLGNNMAVKAHNCMLKSGKLVPIKQPSKISADGVAISFENNLSRIGAAHTIYFWHRSNGETTLLAWPGVVDVAESNLSVDPKSRIFVSGETGIGESGNEPCVYLDSTQGDGIERGTLCKDPLPAPIVQVAEPSEDQTNIRYTYFFQTWIDKYGYESGVSKPSSEIIYNNGDLITIAETKAEPNMVARRVYKVVSGTESESVQFVFQQDKLDGGTSFMRTSFRVNDEDLGEVIPTLAPPPTDLEMIHKVPNGFYAGVKRSNLREVRFSELGNPSQWPDAYTASVFDDIVGLGITLNTIFVLTKGEPWAITGTNPNEMSAAILATAQGCVSKDSICSYGGNVFYASADGICMLRDGSTTADIITDKIFSRNDWQDMNPGSCRIVAHDSSLFCWFEGGKSSKNIIINLLDDSSIAVTTHDELASAVCVDVEDDSLFFVRAV